MSLCPNTSHSTAGLGAHSYRLVAVFFLDVLVKNLAMRFVNLYKCGICKSPVIYESVVNLKEFRSFNFSIFNINNFFSFVSQTQH